jgi:hypothetical protein
MPEPLSRELDPIDDPLADGYAIPAAEMPTPPPRCGECGRNYGWIAQSGHAAGCTTGEVEPDRGRGDRASCGHPNPIWWTDHRLWNEVMGGDPDTHAGGVLCPSCFAARADEHFENTTWRITGWRLVAEMKRV